MKMNSHPIPGKSILVGSVMAVAGVLLFPATVHAQSDSYRRQFPANGRLELSLGGFTPNSVETRTDDTSTWTRLGISLRLNDAPGPLSSQVFLDFGSQSGALLDTNGIYELRRRRSYAGLGGGWAFSTRVPGSQWAFDIGAGAGMYFLEVAEDFENGAGQSAGTFRVLDRAANFGVRLRGALRAPNGWFLETVWQDPGASRGLSYAGASIAIGKRF